MSHECDDALASLYQYLDRELEAVTAEGIRVHLEDCHWCMERFDFEARLKIVVRERLAEEVPAEFILRLNEALARERSAGH